MSQLNRHVGRLELQRSSAVKLSPCSLCRSLCRLNRSLPTAFIPNAGVPAGAFVFSVSTLVGSDPVAWMQIMPVALELASGGRPTIVLERELTWPDVEKSVGHLQAAVLCAQPWLAAHAPVKPDDWTFVAPKADVPTFGQLQEVGDTKSMTFLWVFPIAGFNEYKNTEDAPRDGFLRVALLIDFHD